MNQNQLQGPYNFAPIRASGQTTNVQPVPNFGNSYTKPTPKPSDDLDLEVVNLAKAIRKVESKDNFYARGKSGEYGAYQFMPNTWQKWSEAYLDQPVPLEMATPTQQNEVAYKHIKTLKDNGYRMAEIASLWNSGDPDWNGKVGVNKMGVPYNVPKYVDAVSKTYHQIKSQPQPTPREDYSASENYPQTAQQKGFLGTTPGDSTYGKIIDNSITRGIQSVFPGQQVGKAIGTLGGYALSGFSPHYDTSAPNPLRVGADIAQGALLLAPGPAPSATALGRIGQSALLGSGFGTTGAIAKGEDKIGEIAKQAAFSGALGALVGGGIEGVKALLHKLPPRIIHQYLPKASPKTAKYALEKGLHSPEKMLEQSDDAIRIYGDELGLKLRDPKYTGVTFGSSPMFNQINTDLTNTIKTYDNYIAKGVTTPSSVYSNPVKKIYKPEVAEQVISNAYNIARKYGPDDVLQQIGSYVDDKFVPNSAVFNVNKLTPDEFISKMTELTRDSALRNNPVIKGVQEAFPNANLSPKDIINNLKRISPLDKGLIDKFASGQGISLNDLHTLNSDLGSKIYKSTFDGPSVKASKEIANAFYQKASEIIKQTAPDTVPIFNVLSQEYALKKALESAVQKGIKSKTFSLYDLLALFGGHSVGGVPGMIAAITGEKILRNPTANLNAAGLLNKLSRPNAGGLPTKGLLKLGSDALRGITQ